MNRGGRLHMLSNQRPALAAALGALFSKQNAA
jgi:hypothetical protein